MKLKASEIAFIAVCTAAALISVASVYIVKYRLPNDKIEVSFDASAEKEQYDVSVINSASLEDFMQISGIGEVKAGDIIAYREALGGFDRVERLLDVNGISEALYQRIIDYFYIHTEFVKPADTSESFVSTQQPETSVNESETVITTEPPVISENTTESETAVKEEPETVTEKIMRPVDINRADASEIADALIIDMQLAEEIVSLRNMIHGFSTVQELDLCDSMTDEIYRRIKNYVRIN